MDKATTELVEGFRKVATASVADAVDKVVGRRGFMSSAIKAITGTKLAGPAVTVLEGSATVAAPPIHALETLDTAAAGSIVVIGIDNPAAASDVAVWGGLMTTAAVTRSLEGAVLDAGVRDVEETTEMGFTVFARSVIPSTTVGRYVTLDRDVPVVCGGVLVRPGDIVVGDRDGVVVVPLEAARDVLTAAEEIEATEASMAEDIKATGSIREALRRHGRI